MINELLLKDRIISVLQQKDENFVDVDNEQLTNNINLIYSTSYTQDEVNKVIGLLYEEQFYYEHSKLRETD